MTYLGPAESFKTMNRPGPTVMLFDGLFLGIYRKIETWKISFKSSIHAIEISPNVPMAARPQRGTTPTSCLSSTGMPA